MLCKYISLHLVLLTSYSCLAVLFLFSCLCKINQEHFKRKEGERVNSVETLIATLFTTG